MENIIKKAIEGGWKENFVCGCDVYYGVCEGHIEAEQKIYFLDPLFWSSLGKACGWNGGSEGKTKLYERNNVIEERDISQQVEYYYALHFHEINLTEGFDAAVKWLNDLIK